MTTPYDAIVLAGGRARRLPGKLALVGPSGLTLLEDTVAGILDAGPQSVIVVGPPDLVLPRDRRVVLTQEYPPYAGPAAAVLAALDSVTAPFALLMAGDSPGSARAIPALLRAAIAPDLDAATLVDSSGRLQPLCSAVRADALRRTAPVARSAMGLLAGLSLAQVADTWGASEDLDDAEAAIRRGYSAGISPRER